MFNKLLIEARGGDIKALEEIINRLQPLIISSIRKYYNKPQEYEDLIQDGNIMILECLKNFDESRGVHFLGYIKVNLKYLYLNQHKRKIQLSLNEPISDGEVEILDLLVSDDKDIIDMILEKEQNDDLRRAMDKLTQRQRQVILYYYFERKSIAEIGKILGISYRTVVNTKTKAIENLRKWTR